MPHFDQSIQIEAPLKQVWDSLSSFCQKLGRIIASKKDTYVIIDGVNKKLVFALHAVPHEEGAIYPEQVMVRHVVTGDQQVAQLLAESSDISATLDNLSGWEVESDKHERWRSQRRLENFGQLFLNEEPFAASRAAMIDRKWSPSNAFVAEKATFLRRAGADILDSIILAVVAFTLGLANPSTDNGLLILLYSYSIPSFMHFVYRAYFYSTSGQTIGKRIAGIKVVSIDGSSLNFKKGISRALGYILLSGIFFGIGFLWMLWDRDKQTWHDKAAGTIVVRDHVNPAEMPGRIETSEMRRRQRPWQIALAIITLINVGIIIWLISVASTQTNASVAISEQVSMLDPWPPVTTPLDRLRLDDLSSLELDAIVLEDVRREGSVWEDSRFGSGSLVAYAADEEVVGAIWILRFPSPTTAETEITRLLAMVENCAGYEYAVDPEIGKGYIYCNDLNEYSMFIWNTRYIVHILGLERSGFRAAMLANDLRDALAAHWRTLN